MKRADIKTAHEADPTATFALARWGRTKGIDAEACNEVRLVDGAEPAYRKVWGPGGWSRTTEHKPTGIEVEYVVDGRKKAGEHETVQPQDIVATWSDYQARRREVNEYHERKKAAETEALTAANIIGERLVSWLPDNLVNECRVVRNRVRQGTYQLELSPEAAQYLTRKLEELDSFKAERAACGEPCTVPGCGGWC